MAIAAITMIGDGDKDGHEYDLVMPGFRFHPTEEELIEFYLRRKVEGKRFNIDLIVPLDLYRYDPWELPSMAAIGEKEWYFYVPRYRKYRNGDRPNRVTKSGYWKATGADRMIWGESSRSIGLKKTLVFYSGKAPRGIRTSWIMNEYRLPQNETNRHQKAEISLCRVYKRSGIQDHHHLLRTPSGTTSSRDVGHQLSSSFTTLAGDTSSSEMEKMCELGECSSSNNMMSFPLLHKPTTNTDSIQLEYSKSNEILVPSCAFQPPPPPMAAVDELNRILAYHQNYLNRPNQFIPQCQLFPINSLPNSLSSISEKLWEWSYIQEASRD